MSSTRSNRIREALSRMPTLTQWFLSHSKAMTIAEPASFHLWSLVRALRTSEDLRCRTWTDAISLLIESKYVTLDHILETDEIANSLGQSLTDIYTPLAESALLCGEGSRSFLIFQKLADLSGLAAFRFLSAWTAFNNDKLAICIAECEKTMEPFAPIHTLLGQAFLESGKTSEAIDALKVAINLDPSDPLPRVQLIKAYLVLNIPTEAMRMIDECRKILGLNIELECLAAMAVIASPTSKPEFAEQTLYHFSKHLKIDPSDFEAFALAMNVATTLARKDWGKAFIDTLDLGELGNPAPVISKLPGLLKTMHELEWHEATRVLIDKTIVFTKAHSLVTGFKQ